MNQPLSNTLLKRAVYSLLAGSECPPHPDLTITTYSPDLRALRFGRTAALVYANGYLMSHPWDLDATIARIANCAYRLLCSHGVLFHHGAFPTVKRHHGQWLLTSRDDSAQMLISPGDLLIPMTKIPPSLLTTAQTRAYYKSPGKAPTANAPDEQTDNER